MRQTLWVIDTCSSGLKEPTEEMSECLAADETTTFAQASLDAFAAEKSQSYRCLANSASADERGEVFSANGKPCLPIYPSVLP